MKPKNIVSIDDKLDESWSVSTNIFGPTKPIRTPIEDCMRNMLLIQNATPSPSAVKYITELNSVNVTVHLSSKPEPVSTQSSIVTCEDDHDNMILVANCLKD